MPRALVRRPGPRLADGLVTHIERSPVDLDLARHQWERYVAALLSEGWEVVEVEPAEDCPDAVFVEDTVVVLGRDTELTRLPWIGHRSRDWEPEPLRWLGINAGLRAMTLADAEESVTRMPSLIAKAAGPLLG